MAEPRQAIDPESILSSQQPEDRASHPAQNEAMPKNHHDAKTEPSRNEELARVLDDMEPMASTSRQLGFMRGLGIASADLKRGFADDINSMFRP